MSRGRFVGGWIAKRSIFFSMKVFMNTIFNFRLLVPWPCRMPECALQEDLHCEQGGEAGGEGQCGGGEWDRTEDEG